MANAQILVVEDEGIIAKDIKNTLSLLGYSVIGIASSGEKAIEKAMETHPDLVLMDIVLEGDMDGVEAAEHIRDRFDIPVVYITAYSDDTTLQRAKITEPYGYILKPFQERELYTTIEMALYKHMIERKLKESEQWLTTTLKSIGDAVIATDTGNLITFMNPVAEFLTGWKQKDAIGKPLKDVFKIINEKTGKQVESPAIKVLREGVVVGLANHTVLISKDGTKRPVDDCGAPIKNDKGEIIGVVLVFRDITKRRQSEEEREKLEAQLLQAKKMEAIGTLAGGIAHDFNNLLMGIQGQASLMLLDIAPDHPHYKRLKSIENTVQTGAGLSKQLLGFARGGRYEVKPTNLNELIKHSSEMFARTQKNITINEKYHKDIWTVEVDQGQINQVLLNLYVNAWQAMPEGGSIYIETSNVELEENYSRTFSIKPGNYVKISVTDTGVGIDKAIQPRVFEPFFTTREIGHGTGLGLASAYGIIKNHGGIINLYSEKGKGTTFTIHLPVSEKEVPIIKKKLDNKIQKGTETILLVDDEDIIIDVGKDMLDQLGYKVLSAKTGEKAIEIYRKHKDNIDMAILDMIMPHMSGSDTYDRMKEINPDIKVLLSSGYSIDGQATDILNRGCNGFIQKPFNMNQLSAAIKKILEKK